MARLPDYARLTENLKVEIDFEKVSREAFGILFWRLKLSKFLFRLGCRVMRCSYEMKGADETTD